MKKVLAIVAVLVLVLSVFAGCTKTTKCEMCGETKKCKQISYEGEKGWFCTDTCAPIVEGFIKMAG